MLTPYQYLPKENRPGVDALIAQWWAQLVEANELEATFGKGSLAISQFYKLLTEQERLFLYDTDAEGICLGFLLTPMMNAAFLTLWVAPRLRKGFHYDRDTLLTIEDAYGRTFEGYPVILGVTKQERLLNVHQHWGYVTLGKIPAIFDGDDAWLEVLTKEAFEAAQERRHRRWEAPQAAQEK